MKKIICTVIALAMLLSAAAFAESASFKVGICNYVDDASLNQIVDNIQAQLAAIGEEQGLTFVVDYDIRYTDNSVMSQIIANCIDEDVDLMVCVSTPGAMVM